MSGDLRETAKTMRAAFDRATAKRTNDILDARTADRLREGAGSADLGSDSRGGGMSAVENVDLARTINEILDARASGFESPEAHDAWRDLDFQRRCGLHRIATQGSDRLSEQLNGFREVLQAEPTASVGHVDCTAHCSQLDAGFLGFARGLLRLIDGVLVRHLHSPSGCGDPRVGVSSASPSRGADASPHQ